MRNGDNLETLFDECIERLAQGESLEDCLPRDHASADELRGLLATVQMLSTMAATPTSPPTLMTYGKRKFQRAVGEITRASATGPAPAPPTARHAAPLAGRWFGNPRPLSRWTVFGVAALTIIAFMVAITALSISALPGDLFYPPKVVAETLDLNLKKALNPPLASEYQEVFDNQRATDVERAMGLGRRAPVTMSGFIVYADEYSLSLNTGVRVILPPGLPADIRANLRQGVYLTIIGTIDPDQSAVQASRLQPSAPAADINFTPPPHPTATPAATRRPIVVPPTRRPVVRPTRPPRPTATRVPRPTTVPTWTPTVTGNATASATPLSVTATATPTAVDATLTPDSTTVAVSPTPTEQTPTPLATATIDTPTPTMEPPTPTSEPPPSDTPEAPTPTPAPPTATPEPPTATPEPPTATPELSPTTPEAVPMDSLTMRWASVRPMTGRPGHPPVTVRPARVCAVWLFRPGETLTHCGARGCATRGYRYVMTTELSLPCWFGT